MGSNPIVGSLDMSNLRSYLTSFVQLLGHFLDTSLFQVFQPSSEKTTRQDLAGLVHTPRAKSGLDFDGIALPV